MISPHMVASLYDFPVLESNGAAPDMPDTTLRPQRADECVASCLEDLIDDWVRMGGQLSYHDVTG